MIYSLQREPKKHKFNHSGDLWQSDYYTTLSLQRTELPVDLVDL